eukprot:1274265-Amorphochlora_amoeboformis.AAC.2
MAMRTRRLSRNFSKVPAPPMVYIRFVNLESQGVWPSGAKYLYCLVAIQSIGEEMTRYCMELILDQWIKPRIDISQAPLFPPPTTWEFYDLSCKARDDTEDKVLHDAVDAGRYLSLSILFASPLPL